MIFSSRERKAQPDEMPHCTAVPLGGVSEAGLVTLYAMLIGEHLAACEVLQPVYGIVTSALRAELTRRWQARGAAVEIEFPARLPALAIETAGQLFRTLTDALRPSEEALQKALDKEVLRTSLAKATGAADLAGAIVAALEASKVALCGGGGN